MFSIKVMILGVTEAKTVTVSGSATVREIFNMAAIDTAGNYTFKLDGVPVTLDTPVTGGSLLTGAAQIKGN